MTVGVICTSFMKEYISSALDELDLSYKWDILIYNNYRDVTDVYLENEKKYDGFLISGPLPKRVIIDNVGTTKPLRDFGTDLQSYYESFLSLIFKYGTDFSRCYFDMIEWCDLPYRLEHHLANGSFAELQRHLHTNSSKMSAQEIVKKEIEIKEKHLRLWKSGTLDYSMTRISSIVDDLHKEGVNCVFVYPHKQVIKSAMEMLKAEIDMHRLKSNRTCAIRIRSKEDTMPGISLKDALIKINKQIMGDFCIQKDENDALIYLGYKTVNALTEDKKVCLLKKQIEELTGGNVNIGYGCGVNLGDAISHASKAITESIINCSGDSYLVDEQGDIFGPLTGKGLKVKSKATPEVLRLSQKVGLSTLTVQKLISAFDIIGRDEVTPALLATTLNITSRSANRFLNTLVQTGEGEIAYEKQSASRGRPVHVYKVGLYGDK